MKRPVKILFISHSSKMAGAEKSLLLLLKHINRKLIEPVVVLPGHGPLKEELTYLRIKIYEIKSPWLLVKRKNLIWPFLNFVYCMVKGPIALYSIYNVIKQEKIDMVYSNTIVIFSGAIIAFITKKPHVWHIREIIHDNPELHSLLSNKMIFKLILRLSNNIIANSEATASQFQYLEQVEKIKVIYNAIDFDEFKGLSFFPNINGANQTDWLVAVVGTLQEGKAQDDAIRAVKIAKETIPNIRLLLIGEVHKAYMNYLKKVIVESDISDNVIFTGYRKDVPEILSYCKVLLMPSTVESFGRAAVEAMAAGIPVVGTNIGGIKEILQEGVTGFTVPPKSPMKIAEKIIYLFLHPEIATTIVVKAKMAAEEKFNINNYIQNIEKVLLLSFTTT
jgi:glycosyltransferase involved in cell wall biosynthesis